MHILYVNSVLGYNSMLNLLRQFSEGQVMFSAKTHKTNDDLLLFLASCFVVCVHHSYS